MGGGRLDLGSNIENCAYKHARCFVSIGLSKSHTAWLSRADIVAAALDSPIYGSRSLPSRLLRSRDWLLRPVARSTLYAELAAGMLVLCPLVWPAVLRTSAFVMICGLHLGLLATMHLHMFPYYSMALALPILPATIWDHVPHAVWDLLSNPFAVHHAGVTSDHAARMAGADRESGVAARVASIAASLARWSRVLLCFFLVAYATLVLPTAIPRCDDSEAAAPYSFGCMLPKGMRSWRPGDIAPHSVRVLAAATGFNAWSAAMFHT